MLNRFQQNNEGMWASQTVKSAQCIAWPSPTLFLLLAWQAVNILYWHRYRRAKLKDNEITLSVSQEACHKHNVTYSCSNHVYSLGCLFNTYSKKKKKIWLWASWWHDRLSQLLELEWWGVENHHLGWKGAFLNCFRSLEESRKNQKEKKKIINTSVHYQKTH